MTVTLNPQTRLYVEAMVSAGVFDNADDAVITLLGHAQNWHSMTPEELKRLRAAAREGIEDLEQGRVTEFTVEQVAAESRAATKRRTGS